MGTDWRLVVPGDQLRPGIYEFDADFSIVLSQLSLCRSYSIPSSGAESIEKTLYRHLEIREGGRCGVTRAWGRSLKAFHLIPKRMGTEGAKQAVAAFVGAEEALQAHQYHPMVGILLFGPLAIDVDQYMLGFYHNVVSNSRYIFSNLLTRLCHLGRHIVHSSDST